MGSAQKRWDGDGFEAVVRGAAADHLGAKGRALPGLDQQGGKFCRVEIGPDRPGLALARAHARLKSGVPAVEDVTEFSADRFTGTPELQRQVADQAAQQEVTGLVLVGEFVEEARDSLLSWSGRLVENWEQPRL